MPLLCAGQSSSFFLDRLYRRYPTERFETAQVLVFPLFLSQIKNCRRVCPPCPSLMAWSLKSSYLLTTILNSLHCWLRICPISVPFWQHGRARFGRTSTCCP